MRESAGPRIMDPTMRFPRFSVGLVAGCLTLGSAGAAGPDRPHVLLLTVDTLRADRMSGYVYERATSPHLDRLMRSGVRFTEARTVEPLTAPALCAMLTSRFPQEIGATRNGLRMRPELPSLPKLLSEQGYRTAAVVSSWTLRDKTTGLAEHFDEYEELLTRRRWLGMVSPEARAEEVTASALERLELFAAASTDRPFFFWVHYIDPHAPYKKHKPHLEALGIEKKRGRLPASDRYDSEIAYTDRSIGELLARLDQLGLADRTLIAFTSDHGESLGEHDYWGHGRHLYEPTLHVPMSLTWPGRIEPGTIEAPALIIDLAPTIADLLGLDYPSTFRGFDWTGVLAGDAPPLDRETQYQAHRGAVLTGHDSDFARLGGLLELAVLRHGHKEIVRVKDGRRWRFDLDADPGELKNLTDRKAPPPEALQVWMDFVDAGLRHSDEIPPEALDDETIARLRALGYAD